MPPRALLALILLACGAPPGLHGQAPALDLLIVNGRLLDGSGNPWVRADVGIAGDRIVFVGAATGRTARRVIDARGGVVAPGFIDVHSHAGPVLAGAMRDAAPLLAQGVTTVIVNPDGGGPVDLAAQRRLLEDAGGTGVNIGALVPHGAIRQAVLGMADRAPDAIELDRMRALVRGGLDAGALGLSTGLYYAPGSYARTDEIVALMEIVAAAGGVHASHIRDESDYTVGVVAAVREIVEIAERTRTTGIVTHVKALGPATHGLAPAIAAEIQRARDRGVAVFADQYPYEASSTGLGAALLPRWAQAGGREAMVARLRGPERARIREAVAENVARRGGAATLLLTSYAPDRALERRTLAEIASSASRPVADVALDLLERGDGGLVSFNMAERDITHLMRQPWTMTSSDGDIAVPGQRHPRGYGTFPRKLRLYAAERGVLTLEEAVRSMTGLPAAVFGLGGRGGVREGAYADLVVFDPAELRDRATYEEPHRPAEGMAFVIVNGVPAVDGGAPTGRRAGRWLSRAGTGGSVAFQRRPDR